MAETNDYNIDECGGVACAFLQNLFRLLSPRKLPHSSYHLVQCWYSPEK